MRIMITMASLPTKLSFADAHDFFQKDVSGSENTTYRGTMAKWAKGLGDERGISNEGWTARKSRYYRRDR
jgi:hypothetical protein